VLECGVVGVPDDKTGEAVKVVVFKKDPARTKPCTPALAGAPPSAYFGRERM
jgi:acyl-coenzyme A synthetase/AMP-(fatty) acid ligase